jgi:mannose-6-phosphate isomerase-like protein (cupin superfamily)
MNVREYIESGVLQNYCLGLLSEHERVVVEETCVQYPAIQKELIIIQEALEHYSESVAIPPIEELQQEIWHVLENINKERHTDLTDLPVINKYSDYQHWRRIIQPLIPDEVNGDTEKIQMLRHDDKITQVFFISSKAIPDETHEHEQESFIVLEGECECCIDDKIIRLGPGGFIEIPMYTHHDVKAITPYVIAIMQRIAV